MPFDKNQIRTWAIKQLEIRGCKMWRQTFVPIRGRTFQGPLGAADASGIGPAPHGVRVECEIKAVGDKIRDDQRAFMKTIREHGGWALLATEENGKLVIKEFPTI